MLNKKSEANLEIAKLCLEKEDENFFSAGVSRAYYAIFQATKYLLEKNCFDYKKFKRNEPRAKKQRDYAHGSISIALEYFLLNNGFNGQNDLRFINYMYTTFNKLYYWRLESDYKDTVISKKTLKKALKRTEMFINELKKYNI
ncbi:MAG: HEPN domain-containing protein [Spirochaetes bacterium]|nr:HEPN domain-containing protein [Spirochaetota bacterium]